MEMTHDKYLDRILYDKKMQKRELEVERRIFLAKNKAEEDMLEKDIASIERQLEDVKKIAPPEHK